MGAVLQIPNQVRDDGLSVRDDSFSVRDDGLSVRDDSFSVRDDGLSANIYACKMLPLCVIL